MSVEKNGIEWKKKQDNTIEWDEIKDNLQILKAKKEDFIDLGNPFQSPRASFARSEMNLPSRHRSSRKWVYGCIVALLLVSALFYLRNSHLNSVIEISEAWDVSYTIDISLSNGIDQIEYKISVNPEKTVKAPVKFCVDDSYEGEILPGNEEQILYENSGNELPKEICVYINSFFGRKIIDTLKIPIYLDSKSNKIYLKNEATYDLYVISGDNQKRILKSGENLPLPIVPNQNISILLIDLKAKCVYRISAGVKILEK